MCNRLYKTKQRVMSKTKKNISIYDIAKSLSVSASTVSRALQDHPRISLEVRRKVQKKAQELNYKPNRMAVNLKLGKSNTIGVVVPNINRNFFSSVIDGIEEEAYKAGYDVLICQSQESYEKEKKVINSLAQGKVDGVIASIASGTREYSHYNSLENYDIPLVLFDRTSSEVAAAGTVTIDDYRGGYMAVEHLVKQGRRRIFHFAGFQHVAIWHNRCRGYRDAMRDNNLAISEDWITYGDIVQENGEAMARRVVELKERPDAIFCTSDFVALGLMLELMKLGVRVPEDIAICGFANEPIDALVVPSLSSVNQFSKSIGQQAARMLLEQLNGQSPANIILEPELVIRDSTMCNNVN